MVTKYSLHYTVVAYCCGNITFPAQDVSPLLQNVTVSGIFTHKQWDLYMSYNLSEAQPELLNLFSSTLHWYCTLYSDTRGAAAPAVALTSSVSHRTRITNIMATLTISSKRPYHIIVFGATGFTGQFVVEEVARTCTEGPGGSLQWAVAGRKRDRLEKTLIQAADALCTCLTQ